MHSSLIKNIRILKPRKAANSSTRSYTITNRNCHSSLTPKSSASDDQPPPLVSQDSLENTPRTTVEQYVPVYIVNVPKSDAGKPKDAHPSVCTSSPNLVSQAQISPKTSDGKPGNSGGIIKIDKSVSCFLCSAKFNSVEEMQDHYLDTHKQKRRCIKYKKDSAATRDAVNTSGDSDIGEEGEPKCPICSIGFKSKEEVQEHMGSVHCYDCSDCKNTFYTLFQFTDHKCVKVIRQKKGKFKKKKRIREKDPLALPSHMEEARTTYSAAPKVSSAISINTPLVSAPMTHPASITTKTVPQYPLLLHVPMQISTANYSQSPPTNSTFILSNQNNLPSVSNFYTVPVASTGMSEPPSLKQKEKTESLSDYTMEELKSKEMVMKKLREISNNPSLSLSYASKAHSAHNKEYYTCGRCNVLCEDKIDYMDHIEECLRLSNVSVVPSTSRSLRILNLRAELSNSKNAESYEKTLINQSLLKELKKNVNAKDHTLFNDFHCSESNESQPKRTSDTDSFQINGSVSIKKIPRLERKQMNDINDKLSMLMKSKIVLQDSHLNKSQQPMVIIPMNNSSQLTEMKNKDLRKQSEADEHYPDISITDKSNSVTYNFNGQNLDNIFRVESTHSSERRIDKPQHISNISNILRTNLNVPGKAVPFIKDNKLFVPVLQMPNQGRINTPLVVPKPTVCAPASLSSECIEDNRIHIKEEPSSPSPSCPSPNNISGGKTLDSVSKDITSEDSKMFSLDLLLEDDDMKIEVEDEVVDDEF